MLERAEALRRELPSRWTSTRLDILVREGLLARDEAPHAQRSIAICSADERRHVLVLDEVHVMPDEFLEDVRLLSIADFDRKSPFVLVLARPPVAR